MNPTPFDRARDEAAEVASESLGKTQTPGEINRKAFKQGYCEGANFARAFTQGELEQLCREKDENWSMVLGLLSERDELRAEVEHASTEIDGYIRRRNELKEELTAMKEQRDRYALAMACALREGIFANKAAVKAEIERILNNGKETE